MNPVQQSPTVNSSDIVAAQAEAVAYLAKVSALAVEGNKLGNLALEHVAKNLGESCDNKNGRPSENSFVAFSLAMSSRNLSVGARNQLAQVANKAAISKGEGHKPVFKLTAAGSSIEGGFNYKLNMPVRVALAIS